MQVSITAFIVDDEFQSRNLLAKLIAGRFEGVQLIGQAGTIEESFTSINDLHPDVVFLDVMLNEVTGFDLLQKFEELPFEVIFTTAHDEYAVKAFKFNAIDYLLKPIDPDELQAALLKVRNKLELQQHTTKEQFENLYQSLRTPNSPTKKIPIPTSEGFLLVPLQEILYCQSSGNYTQINLTNKRRLVSSYTLKHYDEMLSEYDFFRAHKSFLVNLSHVTQYRKGEGGTIVMSDSMEIELSRRNKDAFIKIFKS